ncbi:MAG: DNA-binding response regulator [Bacteroidetes bacterium]|nr:MAG: DNA-binding response regulator [Bacteroidota bacterium]
MYAIYVIEPEPMPRQGLVRTIEEEPDLVVCGEAATAAEAMTHLHAHVPDLLILELDLPDLNGLDLMRRLPGRHPDLPMLAMSGQAEAICAEQVLRAGGRGYVVRYEPIPVIRTAIRQVLAGHFYVSERVADELYRAVAGSRHPLLPLPSDVLSPREMELFELLGRGLDTHAIADRMQVRVTTVESYRNRIREKLNVARTADLILLAAKWAQEERVCYSRRGCHRRR